MKKKILFPILLCSCLSLTAFARTPINPLSAPLPDDDFHIFIDQATSINNVTQLSARGLARGAASFPMWAGSYWPIHQGLLGERFADPNFPRSKVFTDNYTYFQLHPPDEFVALNQINQLSPAEKYDLLVGDSNWTLTNAMWARGLSDMQTDGSVPTWTGICNGWAAAVHMGVKSPRATVFATDVTGQHTIEFYKEDIKALMSYLWAESSVNSIQAGARCQQDNPVTDPYLRPTDAACLDSNPMTFHLALANRVGLYANSFVMDDYPGSQVWNYPIKSYDYNYFNPRTFESTHSLKAAIEPIENLPADKFKVYRSPQAKYIVGVNLDVITPALIAATVQDSNSGAEETDNFNYDLELDANLNVVGGEWYSAMRPDFIWSYPNQVQTFNREDTELSTSWNVNNPLPNDYSAKAKEASARGKVLDKIAEAILNQSLDH